MGKPAALLLALVLVLLWPALIAYKWRIPRNLWKDLTGPHWLPSLISFALLTAGVFLFPGFYSDINSRWHPYWPWHPVELLGSMLLFAASLFIYFRYVVGTKRRHRHDPEAMAECGKNASSRR